MKQIGVLVRGLFFLALVAALGWNFWQLQQLQTEVSQLRAELRKVRTPREKPTLAGSLSLLRASKAHTEKAQGYLKARKLPEAARETKQAADTAQKAYSGARAADPLGELQSTVQSLSKQVGSLWETETKKDPKKP